MRYVIAFIIFACLQIQVQGQAFDLRFTLVQNDKVQGGIFSAKIQIKKSFGSSFKLGSSNIRFDYNENGLAIASFQLAPVIDPLNFNSGVYNLMTATGSGNGFYSLNIDLATANSGTPLINESDWTDVAIVQFIIIDIHQTSQLVFRNASPGNTIVFKDDEQTIMEQGTFTGLNKPLANKLKPIFSSKNDQEILIYPNPAKDHVNIRYAELLPEDKATLHILDINGRIIHTEKISGPENTVNLESLENGCYLLQISEKTGIRSTKQLLVMH